MTSLPEAGRLRDALAALRAIVAARCSGKAWLGELTAAAEALALAFAKCQSAIATATDSGRSTTTGRVVREAQAELDMIAQDMPQNLLARIGFQAGDT